MLMFGLEKKGKGEKALIEFDLEKELKADPTKANKTIKTLTSHVWNTTLMYNLIVTHISIKGIYEVLALHHTPVYKLACLLVTHLALCVS